MKTGTTQTNMTMHKQTQGELEGILLTLP